MAMTAPELLLCWCNYAGGHVSGPLLQNFLLYHAFSTCDVVFNRHNCATALQFLSFPWREHHLLQFTAAFQPSCRRWVIPEHATRAVPHTIATAILLVFLYHAYLTQRASCLFGLSVLCNTTAKDATHVQAQIDFDTATPTQGKHRSNLGGLERAGTKKNSQLGSFCHISRYTATLRPTCMCLRVQRA